MTLRFVDSFDHYATADFTSKWSSIVNATPTISASNGRRGSQCLRSNNLGNLSKTLDSQATWIVGLALKVAALPSSALAFIQLLDAGTVQVDLRLNADGTLTVTRAGTTLSTSASSIAAGTFYFIEFKCTISDAAGAYTVKVNGSSYTSGSSVDTKNTANATANQVLIGPAANRTTGNVDIDDLYVCDGAGSTNNDFLGDVRVDAYYPNGNGNSSQLVNDLGNSTNNSTHVDEALQNGDTDYVQSSTNGNKDTYTFTDMSHTPTTIFGLQINMWSKKDDAGTRSLASVIRSAGADTDGTTQALSTSYVDYLQISEADPNGPTAWTKTAFNAAEFGVKVAA